MLYSKTKNVTLPYVKLVKKILSYNIYESGEEEPDFMHTKIRQAVLTKMGYAIQDEEFVSLPPRRERHQRNDNLPPSSSITLKLIHDK